MAVNNRDKPQGESGILMFGDGDVRWDVIAFPSEKAERELKVGQLFLKASSLRIRCESTPELRPFGDLRQNAENDLDFIVKAAGRDKLLELAEFAPLMRFGPTFQDAPLAIATRDKVDEAEKLVRKKSAHQGAAGRLLLLYTTEQAFELSELILEILRRRLKQNPPTFERIYYLCPATLEIGSVHEIYPGIAHEWFVGLDEEQLQQIPIVQTHPRAMNLVKGISWTVSPTAAGEPTFHYTVTFNDVLVQPRAIQKCRKP